ncbi:MAG: hypothetical protein WA890_15725 [Micromonospora sp.]
MAVIDLGELRDDPEPEPAPRRPRPSAGPYRSLAVLVATLLTISGGGPAPERSSAAVPARPGAEAFLTGDRLYVVQPPDSGRDEGRQLVAYQVPKAGPPPELWRTSLPRDGGVVGLLERAGTVLLTGPVGGDSGPYRTSAVDARTGRPGWQQAGVAVAVGDVVLMESLGREGVTAIRRVDPPTGRTLWSVPTPREGLSLDVGPDGIGRIVVTSASGDVEVRDVASGARLVARNIRPGELPTWQQTQVVGDLLLVIRIGDGTVTGYGLDRLDRRWTARLPLVGYVDRCGVLLCLYRQTGGMWALDPATGVVRWTDARWQAVLRAVGGRFLVSWADAVGARYAVVDGATGRLLADLGAWELAGGDDPADPLIGIRRRADGRLLVAELDVSTGRAQMRDALPDVLGNCRSGGRMLICRRVGGDIGLWRLP